MEEKAPGIGGKNSRDASGVHQLPYNIRPLNTVISAVHAAAMDLRFANSWAWHGRPRCGAVREEQRSIGQDAWTASKVWGC
jgi:hypothetical protein